MQLGITDEQLGIVRRSNWFCTLDVSRQVGHYANRLVGWVCRKFYEGEVLPWPGGFEFAANCKHDFPWKFLHEDGIQLQECLISLAR